MKSGDKRNSEVNLTKGWNSSEETKERRMEMIEKAQQIARDEIIKTSQSFKFDYEE